MLAKAECQAILPWLTHRFREQARSHSKFHGYSQSLCVRLWISCSPIAVRHANQALQACDQKIASLTCGFYWLFSMNKDRIESTVAPNLCWRFCG